MRRVLFCRQHVGKLLSSTVPRSVPVQRAIGVALSGGPDSTALAYLLHRHAVSHRPDSDSSKIERVTALIVDHRLRAGSSQEAEQVSKWTRALGIPCEVQAVPWGEPPFPCFPSNTSVEASARTARIILYKRFLRKHGLQHLYLAHHLDDQVETAYLRQRRGTASALALPGLRSFTHLPLIPDPVGPEDESLALVRPLLSVTKAELVDFCKHHKLNYVIDPTNGDPKYTARNAFRAELSALQSRTSPGCDEAGPLKARRHWMQRLTERRDSLEARVSTLLQKVQQDKPALGTCTFDPIDFRTEPPEVRQLLLSRIARMASPATNTSSISPSNMVELDNAVFGYQCKGTGRKTKITPGAGVLFTAKRQKGQTYWIVSRQTLRAVEKSALRYKLSEGKWSLWDGRFWIQGSVFQGRKLQNEVRVQPNGDWCLPEVLPKLVDGRLVKVLSGAPQP